MPSSWTMLLDIGGWTSFSSINYSWTVDDFICGGCEGNVQHEQLVQKIQPNMLGEPGGTLNLFNVGFMFSQHLILVLNYNKRSFLMRLKRLPFHVIDPDMKNFRQKMKKNEHSEVYWAVCHGYVVKPVLFSVDVNFLITSIPVSTVGDINKANKLVRDVKKWKHLT